MTRSARVFAAFAVLSLGMIPSVTAQRQRFPTDTGQRFPADTAVRQPIGLQPEAAPSPTLDQIKALALQRARERGVQAADVIVLIAGSSVAAVAVPADVPQTTNPVARGYAAPQPVHAGIVLLVTNGDLQGAKVHTLSLEGSAGGQSNLKVANERGNVYKTVPVTVGALRGPSSGADMATWRQTGSSTDNCAEAKRKFWCRLGDILLDILVEVGKELIRKELGLVQIAP